MEDTRPPSVVDRYFQKRYKTDIQGKSCEDQLILTHSNKICVICIAQSHPIISERKSVSQVKFEGDGWNRLENTVTGKNKRGAQWLERMAPLCCVTCTDGSIYTLRCCVKGQLVEINLNLETRPNLLTEKPSSNGYIAVILPGLKHFDREVERLKSEEQYRNIHALRSRGSTSNDEQNQLVHSEGTAASEIATSEPTANPQKQSDSMKKENTTITEMERDKGSCGNHIENSNADKLL